MEEILKQSKNNLFQSKIWADFQKEAGKKPVLIDDILALETVIALGKKFLWVQKGPDIKNLASLVEESKKRGAIFVRIEPFENIPSSFKAEEIKRKSLLGGQKSPKATRILDINKDLDELLAGMKPKTRYNIRLAEKKGVTVRLGSKTEDIDSFYKLLQKTAQRDKDYHYFDKGYYQKMMGTLGPQDNLFLLLAEANGATIAGILVSIYGEIATYLHGGLNSEYKSLMAPYLLQWEAIKMVKDRGAKLYDFWGVAETDSADDSWAGISRFKEGFGGEKVIFTGTYDIVLKSFWYNLFTVMAKLRRLIK